MSENKLPNLNTQENKNQNRLINSTNLPSHHNLFKMNSKIVDSTLTKIEEVFSLEFIENFSKILLIPKKDFFTHIYQLADNQLYEFFSNREIQSLKFREKIREIKKILEKKYTENYNFLTTALEEFKNYPQNFTYLQKFRKHCILTEKFAYHTCENSKPKFIELYGDKYKDIVTHVMCVDCKECYLSNYILLQCDCKKQYYSSTIKETEDENIFPATWSKYHCGPLVNEMMKCPKCNQILYLNFNNHNLECLNHRCKFSSMPEDINWECSFCKKTFNSDAKVFNPLEFNIYKKTIKDALNEQVKIYPSKLICCNKNPSQLDFYHKEDCKGQLYKGFLYNKEVVVCSRCHSLNYYEKFVWTCPLCKKKFKNVENNFNLLKKKEYVNDEDNNNNNEKYSLTNYNENNNNNNNKPSKIQGMYVKKFVKMPSLKDKREREDEDLSEKEYSNNKHPKNKSGVLKYSLRNREVSNEENKKLDLNLNKHDNKNNLVLSENNATKRYFYHNTSQNKENSRLRKSYQTLNDILENRRNSKNKDESSEIQNMPSFAYVKKHSKLLPNHGSIERDLNRTNNNISAIHKISFNKIDNNNNKIENSNIKPENKITKITINLNNMFDKMNVDKRKREIKRERYNDDDVTTDEEALSKMDFKNLNKKKGSLNKSMAAKYAGNFNIDNVTDEETNEATISRNKEDSKKSKNSINQNSNQSEQKNRLKKFERKESYKDRSEVKNDLFTSPEKLEDISRKGKIPSFDIDDFKFIKSIGEGSFGKIYLIENINNNKSYALKKIICHDLKEVLTFQREFELNYSKRHEHIMKIYNVQYKCLDFTTYSIYVLLELAISDWNKVIKEREKQRKYYTEKEIINILEQIIEGLIFLEQNGIAHRDIKPQNILVYENNVYKLADFGEAKKMKDITIESTLRGSELYMSPALYNGLKYNKKDVVHNAYKSDVFSLGYCLLFAMTLSINILNDIREITYQNMLDLMISKALKIRYSQKIIKLIKNMLKLNENERFDFMKIKDYLKENYNY